MVNKKNLARNYLRIKDTLQSELSKMSPVTETAYKSRKSLERRNPKIGKIWRWF